MKRLSGIFIIFAMTWLLTSGNPAELFLKGSLITYAPIQQSDTLDLNSVIRVDRFWLDIIPPSSGIQFYWNGIVFLSHSKAEGKMLESHTSFGTVEAYYATFQDTSLGNHVVFSPSSVWDIPCDAMTFNSDYSLMYYAKKPSNKENEKIFQAKYQTIKGGKYDWISDIKPLSFCGDKSTYLNPALSSDGEKLIFASNRGGSVGGFDLYISYKENISWSSPINLGNKINTPGNEMYPFLDQDNNLFFSSDGIKGIGGYDIYFCRYTGNGWDKPVNLTRSINTPDDDLAFTLSKLDGKSAFYTRKQKTGDKSLRLFKITFRDQFAINKLTNLSNAFKYFAQGGLVSAETDITVSEKVTEVIQPKEEPVVKPVQPVVLPAVQQEAENPPVEKTETSSNTAIYRVQFLSSSQSKGSFNVNVGGKQYQTFEYLYNGAYRTCAGEFSSPGPASDLQKVMKREGYPDAFVVVFRNNVRSLEPIQYQGKPSDKPAAESVQVQKLPEIKQEQTNIQAEQTTIYRVQISASSKPKGSQEISAGGKKYRTYEYFNNGIYRLYAGEFTAIAPAVSLQNILKKEGYPDAFIVVFKNNVRSGDPADLKK